MRHKSFSPFIRHLRCSLASSLTQQHHCVAPSLLTPVLRTHYYSRQFCSQFHSSEEVMSSAADEVKSADPSGAQKSGGKAKKPKKKKLSKEERLALREAKQKAAKAEATPQLAHPDDGDFGELLRNQSQYKTTRSWTEIKDLNAELSGKEVWIRGRVHSVRNQGGMVFLTLRRGFNSVQVAIVKGGNVNAKFVKFAGNLKPESIIDVFGVVSPVKDLIESSTQKDVEISTRRMYTVVTVYDKELPFQLSDASHSEDDYKSNASLIRVGEKLRLDNRWIDLRTLANHAIFRIQSGIGQLFREFLYSRSFIEIHTPKLQAGASEGGADVFRLDYFGKPACLAQSPQLYKQMAICSDLRRVFEIGPVFRAENSNTHRHLCEFTGLDMEMEFDEHYHEVMHLMGDMFQYIFRGLQLRFKNEIEAVRKQYPFEDLLIADELVILTFSEAMSMIEEYHSQLLSDGKQEEADALLMGQSKDFSTPMEKLLGKLVHDKYQTDFYAVDKYPLSARPFYTMPDPYDPSLTNSYDYFIRGEEITSGAQRIHDVDFLIQRAEEHEIPLHTLQSYVDSFKFATNPHGGCGIGLERVVFLFLGLDNIRKSSMFPRDPVRCAP